MSKNWRKETTKEMKKIDEKIQVCNFDKKTLKKCEKRNKQITKNMINTT